jgi:hypothetical protein
MLTFINTILGGALIIAGRKLFWLFVGAAGFVTGFQLTTRYFQGPEGAAIIVGLVFGLIFAVLAIFLQTIAIGIAGFLAGGYILQTLTGMLGFEIASLMWIVYIIGGIIGVLLVSFLFDWAIITLSSLAGATLVVEAFHLQRNELSFVILFLAGVIIQGLAHRDEIRQRSS